jgi:hypothetical protein
MAGLWADSPDYYNTAQLNRIWTALTGTSGDTVNITVAGAGRRPGTTALQFLNVGGVPAGNYYAYLQKTLVPGNATIIHSFAIMFLDFTQVGQETPFWAVGDATVWHLSLCMRNDHTFCFKTGYAFPSSGGGTIIGSTPNPVTTNVWYNFSIKATIGDAPNGAVSFKLNRVEQLGGGAGLTGVDTRNAGTAGWSRFAFNSAKPNGADPIQNPTFKVMDQVVCDSTGSANNDHPGDCSVLVQLPAIGNGGNTDFTPLSGTDHGAMVDEVISDDDGTYNQGGASGARDSYVYPALTVALGTPRFMINRPCLKLAAAGGTNVADVIRRAGTNYDGTTPQSPTSGSYSYYDFIREVDPTTGLPWTIAAINASESGLKVL